MRIDYHLIIISTVAILGFNNSFKHKLHLSQARPEKIYL